MKCVCGGLSRVRDSRDRGAVRMRRRLCVRCGRRFVTFESWRTHSALTRVWVVRFECLGVIS